VDAEFEDKLIDFVTKVADDDWGVSHRDLVTEARQLLGRTYSRDRGSGEETSGPDTSTDHI
jgi:hypothetical protein